MSRRLPSFVSKTKVCIICEGDEEFGYLNRLKQIGVWDSHYDIVLVNAEGNGNIPARYQDKFQNDSFDIVLIFCDTDRKPYEQYADIKRKIDEFHGIDGFANDVVFYGNPCTLDIIVKHWADVDLKTPAKKMNNHIVEQFTGVENYKARKDQIDEILTYVTADNYYHMKVRISARPNSDDEINSSNFDLLADYLENSDDSWIISINESIEF